MIKFAAFLLGINVGGNRKVPMAELEQLLEKNGFENVKTLLNSGNVLFEAIDKARALEKKMHDVIENHFGFDVGVIIRSVDDLRKLAEMQPFKGIKVTPATRLYVTFLSEKLKPSIAIPYISPDKNLHILKVTDTEVISVLTVNKDKGTVDAMKIFSKEFGKNITTRNWNTVEKMLT